MNGFNLNLWLSILGLILPMVVAFVTTLQASSAVKGWILAVLSGVAAVLAELVESGSNLNWDEVGANLLLIFASSVVAYKGGLVKPVARSIQQSTSDTGIGPKTDEQAAPVL